MEDSEIVSALFDRDQAGLAALQEKYGAYCHAVAFNVLGSRESAEETVDDALLAAWNSIPPQRPAYLAAYLARLTRNAAIKRLRSEDALKRGGGAIRTVYEELSECIPAAGGVAETADARALARIINEFTVSLPETQRRIFLCRYWYFDPVADIAARFGFSEAKVTSMLYRLRKKLLKVLTEEGYAYENE